MNFKFLCKVKNFVVMVKINYKLPPPINIYCGMCSFQVAILGDERNSFHLEVARMLEKKTTMNLQPGRNNEVKVVFTPNVIGPVQSELSIREITKGGQQNVYEQKTVEMFGYGGLGLVNWSFMCPVLNNDMSFILSETYQRKTFHLTEYLECQNDGNVPAFIFVVFERKLAPFYINVDLVGQDCVIKPGQKCTVFVNLVIGDDIVKFFQYNGTIMVAHVGMLKLYWGSEILRRRLRRLVNAAKQSDCKALSLATVKLLSMSFEFERTVSENVDLMLDRPEYIDQLLQAVSVNVIPVTIRRNL